ncbi:sensor domain-containing diguanylate cyclase [Consotaella salsifontis]|uniref:diguanylate cyclase n=1 Tax=Consotaella salsifontis TaxID=1365950 RepID=A0A1T4SRK7_9HYPH|nr:sensor domain-containing diguanylate cyclase [Consotaella salsifontis]SKA30859.1 diguanylate cyclase (GGDEF) domain-containing protein [Consotaella salsifontis]
MDELPRALMADRALLALRVSIALACAVILSLFGWTEYQAREKELRNAQDSLVNLSRSLVQQAEDTLEMASVSVSGIARYVEMTPMTAQTERPLTAMLRKMVDRTNQLTALNVMDASGNRIATSFHLDEDKLNFADRAYFQYHRTHNTDGVFVGPPVESRTIGQRMLTVSARINRPDGSFGGVVIAGIRLDFFTTLYSQFDIGKNGSITFFGRDGSFYTRFPYLPKLKDFDFRQMPHFERFFAEDARGTFRSPSPYDGVERVAGYMRGTHYPVVVLAARSIDEVLAAWRINFVYHALTALALVLAIGLLGFRITRDIAAGQRAAAHLATSDGLTGLYNRRAFDLHLDACWDAACHSGADVSVVMVDIDYFKDFNDEYGHPAGDVCLKRVAQCMRQLTRSQGDMAARYGGEEFALVLAHADAVAALRIAQRLRASIEALAIRHPRSAASEVITVSVGCATVTPLSRRAVVGSPSTLVKAADMALYRAKRYGRNRVVRWSDAIDADLLRSPASDESRTMVEVVG